MATVDTNPTINQAPSSLPSVEAPLPSATGVAKEAIQQSAEEICRLTKLRKVVGSDLLKEELSQFLTRNLVILNPERLYKILTEILVGDLSYEEVYNRLLARIREAKEPFFSYYKTLFKSVRVLKEILTDQTVPLVGKGGNFNGYVEIGSAGYLIHALKKVLALKGKKFVVHNNKRLLDYFKAGFPLPYNTFVPLNDYAPLTGKIERGSVELIICPTIVAQTGVGSTPEKIHAFFQSIAEILKAGGTLIVRHSGDTVVHEVAAMIFNAVNHVSAKNEIAHWRKIISSNDLIQALGKLGLILEEVRESTEILIRFTKIGEPSEALAALETFMRNHYEGYVRPQQQTYLTTLEWHLVHLAEEYANFVKDHPIHEFPFLKHISILWKVFVDSCREAIRVSSLREIVLSESMRMNYFMLFFTSAEFFIKWLVYSPLKFLPQTKNSHETSAQKAHAAIAADYEVSMHTIPSYEFPFLGSIKKAWDAFITRKDGRFFLNMYITASTAAEMFAKSMILTPIDWMYHGIRPGEIHLIVKLTDKNLISDYITEVKVIKSFGDYSAIEMKPHNKSFMENLKGFVKQGIEIISIAGQKKIQIKIKDHPSFDMESIKDAATLMQDIEIPTKSTKYRRLNVDISKLNFVLTSLEKQGVEIAYIHDF